MKRIFCLLILYIGVNMVAQCQIIPDNVVHTFHDTIIVENNVRAVDLMMQAQTEDETSLLKDSLLTEQLKSLHGVTPAQRLMLERQLVTFGFLAIYICAIYLGNQPFAHKKDVLKMFDGLAWLMQIVLFLTLGLLVFPSQVIPVAGIGLLISLFLILIARPVSVFVALIPFKMELRRRVYISWVGLRGAVPIVFATYPLIAGIEKAGMIFNIVFFISVTSVLIQGTTPGIVAKWLGVALPEKEQKESQQNSDAGCSSKKDEESSFTS